MYNPGRRGRISSEDKRIHAVTVRLSAGEHAYLSELAEASNMQIAEYFRACALLQNVPRPVPKANQIIWQKLAPLGTNINQLAAAINAGFKIEGDNLPALLNKLMDAITDLRASLLGCELAVKEDGDQ